MGHPFSFLQRESLHKSLVQHGIGYFQEASDVGAVDEVAGRAVFLGRFEAVAVDVDHDFVQAVIHFLARPGQARAVLSHFQTRGCHAARICRLRRTIENPGFQEQLRTTEYATKEREL